MHYSSPDFDRRATCEGTVLSCGQAGFLGLNGLGAVDRKDQLTPTPIPMMLRVQRRVLLFTCDALTSNAAHGGAWARQGGSKLLGERQNEAHAI